MIAERDRLLQLAETTTGIAIEVASGPVPLAPYPQDDLATCADVLLGNVFAHPGGRASPSG